VWLKAIAGAKCDFYEENSQRHLMLPRPSVENHKFTRAFRTVCGCMHVFIVTRSLL